MLWLRLAPWFTAALITFSVGSGARVPPSLVDWVSVQIVVPSAAIDAPLTRFYIQGETWEIDPWEPLPGHLDRTGWINPPGNIVIGGHATYPDNSLGVFFRLTDVQPGDTVSLRWMGRLRSYTVTEIKSVAYDDLTVLYPTTHNRLTLITCDPPSYDASTGEYELRLIVIAELH